MGLAVLVQCREHDRQDDGGVVADEGHDVLVVPVVQRPLGHLQIYKSQLSEGKCFWFFPEFAEIADFVTVANPGSLQIFVNMI